MKPVIAVVIAVLILLSSTSIASAGLSDAASTAISNGMENFCISAADNIFSMSFSGYDDSADNGTVGYIYNIASYTLDPMKFEITQDFIAFSKSVFKESYSILLLCAFIAVLLTHYKTNALQSLEQITGVKVGSKSNILARKAIDGIIVAVFMYVFIYFVFTLNNILTKAVMINIIDVISPSPDNFILYLMMAISYLFMGIFFSLRTLILFLFCGFALIIGFCLLIDFTKESAIGLCAYFVQTVFFQFFIVLYFSACILIIKTVTVPLYASGEETMYLVMLLGGVYIAIKMMFGTKVIKWVGNRASAFV
ncbi:MAG: hypothetical protein KAQ89_00285 [Planctomycetes bacterium]|nr:hypothetical protein [Planctomycetota bacterium]